MNEPVPTSAAPVRVHGCPHPFRASRVDDAVPHGATLEQIVERGLDGMRVPASLRGHGHAYVGERYVPRELWAETVPEPGALVTYRIVPQGGGGGKSPLRIILTIVVIAVAVMTQQYYLANFATYTAAGTLTMGSALMSAGIMAGVTTVGMLAVNAIAPLRMGASLPSASINSQKDSPVYSVTGARNVIKPWGTVPVVLGRHRHVPPQGGLPFTELVGDDQYVRQLFINGYAGLVAEDGYKIGETPVSSYTEIEIEHLGRLEKGGRPRYYTNDVYETSLAIQLTAAGGWQTRRTDQECDSLSIDIAFPRGLVAFDDLGNKVPRTVELEARYRLVGSDTWRQLGGTNHHVAARTFELSPASTAPIFSNVTLWHTFYVSASGLLTYAGGEGQKNALPVPNGGRGVARVRTKGLQVVEVVDLRDPATTTGLGVTTVNGGPGSTSIGSFVSHAKVTIAAGTISLTTLVVTGSQTTPLRRSIGADMAVRGFYDVQARRITADNTDTKISDESWWGVLRSVKNIAPVNFPHALDAISMRIKATGQLSGPVDELNLVMQSACLDWDAATSEWVYRETSNPASLFRHVLQHPANARRVPDSGIDLEQLQHWHEFCEAQGFRYNRIHDFQDSAFDICRDIAVAGRAGIARPDGKWSVVIDEPRTEYVQHFTPRNSWGFKSSRRLPRPPHAWRVMFVNEDKEWQPDERIVYADGYDESSATEFETLELPGVTSAAQAWKLGRHNFAVARLRPEEYELFADMEHLVCTRGDLVLVSHPVPLWGVAQGRVKGVDGPEVIVTVDEPCQMIAGRGYVMRWRNSETGASTIRDVVFEEGAQTEVMLSGSGALPAKGDLFMFGEKDLETAELLVIAVEPAENYCARLILVDYSPAIFDAATGEVPQFDSHITKPYPPAVMRIPTPSVRSVRSDEAVLAGVPGAWTPRIEVSFSAVKCDTVFARLRLQGSEGWRTAGQAPAENGIVYATDVDEGATYEISLRAMNATFGVMSDWSAPVTHTVVGRTTPPPPPDALYLSGQILTWTMPADAPRDVTGWEVLIGAAAAPESQAAMISSGLVTQRRFDLSPWAGHVGRIWVRTVDDAGLRSPGVPVAVNLGDAPAGNEIETVSEAAKPWTGTLTNGQIFEGIITTTATDPIWSDETMWGDTPMWATPYGSMTYVCSHTVTADQAGARLSVRVEVDLGALLSVEYARGESGPWLPMEAGIFGAQGEVFRLRVTTQSGERAEIADITWVFDVPDTDAYIDSFEVQAGGSRLPVPANRFRWITSVTFGLEYVSGGTAVGVRYIDKGIVTGGVVTQGPMVECFDSSGASVAGRIDARLIGAAVGG